MVARHSRSGVRVLACPEGSLDGNQALRALAEDPAVACSWTEDDGSFELSGLAPETEFRVVAAGKGLIPRGAQGDIRGFVRLTPSNSKVHLIVYPAYGGELVVLDRDTRLPIRVSKSIFFTPQQIIHRYAPAITATAASTRGRRMSHKTCCSAASLPAPGLNITCSAVCGPTITSPRQRASSNETSNAAASTTKLITAVADEEVTGCD